jgi:NADH-quinone oxidoreductase subunit F
METPLTSAIRPGGEPPAVSEYEHGGGYQALRTAVRTLSPQNVTAIVKDSGLRGRGGAGFPAGLKWSFVPLAADGAPRTAYMVVNADEMEPGTFKDRMLMEGNPHQLIEGTILAAYAVQATSAYIFLRANYVTAERRLRRAIAEAYRGGYLGKNILGSSWSLELSIHASAGRYICGEETALLNSLEGKRAIPRSKPPHPTSCGLFGKPTLVNNVETLSAVPHIINHGAAWFRGLSRSKDSGTKIYGVSGKVKRPGLWELPMGTPAREIIFEHAGGMQDGFRFRGMIPGGASTDFLIEQHLDAPMDFDSLQQFGSRLGTGTVIVLDDKTCPVGFVHNLMQFFARESCGWCTPCREGIPWVERILGALESGKGEPGDVELLEEHARLLAPGSTFCLLAPGAVEPLGSALRYFREDFDRHIEMRRCPYR